MKDKIKDFLIENEIKVFYKYPQGQTPHNFIVLKSRGLTPKDNLTTYNFDITIYSLVDLDSLLKRIYNLLINDLYDLPGIGNIEIDNDYDDDENKGNLKSHILKLSFDNIEYL